MPRSRCARRLTLSVSLSVVILVLAGACSTGYGRDLSASSSTVGRAPVGTVAPAEAAPPPDSQMLGPPPTFPPPPATTVPESPLPRHIPQDPYSPEPIREIGTIEIPALGLVHPIYQGVTLNNIDLGPSHWTGTADPGQAGNTVFAGHRVTNSRPFRHLDTLVPGDQVVFTVGGVRSVYQVTGNMVVTPDDTWIADQTAEATGTLYACHPPGSLAYRFVVKLALVS